MNEEEAIIPLTYYVDETDTWQKAPLGLGAISWEMAYIPLEAS